MNRHFLKNKKSGFTLIEAVIYMALFGLLIGGAVTSAYNLFEASARGEAHGLLQEEGDFLIAKINWALYGVQAVSTPSIVTGTCSATSTALTVAKWDGSVVTIQQSGSNIVLSTSSTQSVLNNADVWLDPGSLGFVHCFGGGTNPESVTSDFTLSIRMTNGMVVTEEFGNTAYVRR